MKHKAVKILGLVSATTAATLMGGAQASAILIDDFSQEQGVTSNGDINTDEDGTDNTGNGYIGSERTVTVQGDATDTEVDINNGEFTFDTDPQNSDPVATLTYDNFGTEDLTDGGSSNQLTFKSLSGQGEATVSIENGSQESDSFTFDNLNNPQDESVSLSNFSDSVVQNAEEVELTFDEESGGNTNLTADEVSTEAVPFNTQSWIGLALLGSWGTWKYWQRKRTQQS